MFELESNYMTVNKNVLKSGKTEKAELPVSVYADEEGDRYYVPLYAILNEIGGGAVYEPFGFEKTCIYTGEPQRGYTGLWETSDLGEYRASAVVGGVTHSIASYWSAVELRADGTYTESVRFWQDEGEWVLMESAGKYAFFGRILMMLYETESVWRGADYTALEQVRSDELADGFGQAAGACLYTWTTEDWDEYYLDIREWVEPLYGGLAESGEAAPRPGKAR